ncbi:MAG: hypothetical protein K0Q55_3246 [Verrucomicrobia bacterium]|nr:hypothetical protein [Verrucomicrobiota bacterium]
MLMRPRMSRIARLKFDLTETGVTQVTPVFFCPEGLLETGS